LAVLVGYMRVSTAEQNLTLQRDALEDVGCERLYEDICSGAVIDRPGLAKALDQLRAENFDVRDEDVARLSPLGFDHINMLGRYAFILPDQIARGELRPLRDPRNTGDEG
jgi:hypothetical protein